MLKRKSIIIVAIRLFLFLILPLEQALAETAQPPETSSQAGLSLLETAPKAVFAHIMVQFRSKDYSGQWSGWNRLTKAIAPHFPGWEKYHHDPEKKDTNGKPDIPSIYYPLAGLYDMTDPDAVEYQCQLAKMAGIDGFAFDLHSYNESGSEGERWKPECMRLYTKIMANYGLKAVVTYEDSCNFFGPPDRTRQEAVKLAHADMNAWLDLFKDIQYRIEKRPLIFLFSYGELFKGKGGGVTKLLPLEINAWKKQFPADARPVIGNQWLKQEYAGFIEGEYDWICMEDVVGNPEMAPLIRYADMEYVKKRHKTKSAEMRQGLKSGFLEFPMSGVWPEFDDSKVWGWGRGPGLMPGLDGQVYSYLWKEAIKKNYPVVQIATWNDWHESSVIEPSVEHGTKYLEITREYSAKFRKTDPAEGNLMLPIWIYKVRKSTKDKKTIDDMKKACELIRADYYREAEKIVKPWAEKLNVDAVKYWK